MVTTSNGGLSAESDARPRCPGCGHSCCPYPRLECGGEGVVTGAPCEDCGEPATYNETRFACTCGRFLAQSAIRERDFRDDSAFYGIRTEVEWDCSKCGTVKGEGSWEPPLVVVATRVTPPAVRADCLRGDDCQWILCPVHAPGREGS